MAYNEIAERGTADFPIAYFYVDKDHSKYNMAAHWHSEIEILRVLEGEFEATLNSKNYLLKKGDILFMNSEAVHKGTPNNCVYECVVFKQEYLYNENYDTHSFVKSLMNGAYTVNEYFPANDSPINNALNMLFDAVASNSSSRKLRVISSFYSFLAEIAEGKLYNANPQIGIDTNSKKLLKLKEILSHIRSNYSQPFSLEKLSQDVNLSPQYLSNFFKAMTDKSPTEYLIEYRIEKASHRLRSTETSITEIAYACGFSDLSYFIKIFKRLKGTSPGKYRNM